MVCTSADENPERTTFSAAEMQGSDQNSSSETMQMTGTIKEESSDENSLQLEKKDSHDTMEIREDDAEDASTPMMTMKPLYRPRSRSSAAQFAPMHKFVCNGKSQKEIPENVKTINVPDDPTKAQQPPVEEEYELIRPDGGWGWMVLLGTVIVNTLIPGLIKSFGVLFVEFIDVFQATPSSVAWIPALTFALYNLLGPVASMISTKVSCRFATILGGLSATIGLALSYFANSIEYLYFSYGILGGIGAGMSYTPGILIVGQYFEKRRGFANGICASGSALGSIILPPVLNYLLEEYGCRGAILIMCGLVMNVCVGAALYQPVHLHLKKVPKTVPSTKVDDNVTNGTLIKFNETKETELQNIRNNNSFCSVTDCLSPVATKRFLRRPVSNPRFPQIIPDGRIPTSTNEEERVFLTKRSENEPNGAGHGHGVSFTIGSSHSSNVASYTASTPGLGMGSTSGLGLHRSPSVVSTVSSSSFAYLSTIYHGSTTAAYQLTPIGGHRDSISESRGVLATMTTSQCSIGRCTCDKKAKCKCGKSGQAMSNEGPPKKETASVWRMMFDVTLVKNAVFLMITYTVVASGIGYTNLLIVLPAYAAGLGLEKSQHALLLSIIAGADLVGRIGGASLSDIASFPCKYLYMAGFLISGVALMFMPQKTSFEWIASCCAVFGLASGIYIGLMAVLLVNHLGADKLASSFGLSLAVNGVVMLGGPPIIGVIREVIGSYEPVIFMLGVIIFSGGLIIILEPLASRYESRKHMNINNNEATTKAIPV